MKDIEKDILISEVNEVHQWVKRWIKLKFGSNCMENRMENEIKKLINEWNWELTHGSTDNIRKNTIKAFLNDLESLLKFKHENCCGKEGDGQETAVHTTK